MPYLSSMQCVPGHGVLPWTMADAQRLAVRHPRPCPPGKTQPDHRCSRDGEQPQPPSFQCHHRAGGNGDQDHRPAGCTDPLGCATGGGILTDRIAEHSPGEPTHRESLSDQFHERPPPHRRHPPPQRRPCPGPGEERAVHRGERRLQYQERDQGNESERPDPPDQPEEEGQTEDCAVEGTHPPRLGPTDRPEKRDGGDHGESADPERWKSDDEEQRRDQRSEHAHVEPAWYRARGCRLQCSLCHP